MGGITGGDEKRKSSGDEPELQPQPELQLELELQPEPKWQPEPESDSEPNLVMQKRHEGYPLHAAIEANSQADIDELLRKNRTGLSGGGIGPGPPGAVKRPSRFPQ
jgi:hypothetical protein